MNGEEDGSHREHQKSYCLHGPLRLLADRHAGENDDDQEQEPGRDQFRSHVHGLHLPFFQVELFHFNVVHNRQLRAEHESHHQQLEHAVEDPHDLLERVDAVAEHYEGQVVQVSYNEEVIAETILGLRHEPNAVVVQ